MFSIELIIYYIESSIRFDRSSFFFDGPYRIFYFTCSTWETFLQVSVEGRACVGVALAQAVRELFLEQEFEPELLPNSLVLALLTKVFKVITSSSLMKGNF